MERMKRAVRVGAGTFRKTIRAVFGHTRIVASGSYPLYRLICIGGVISAVLTLSYRSWPASFAETTDDSTVAGVIFSAMQLAGCVSVLVGMYFHADADPLPSKVQKSLAIERFGTVLLIPVIAAYTYGVIKSNGGPPTTWATLCLAAFGVYLVLRFLEIGRALEEVQRPIEQCDGHDCKELRSE
ncbi:membrane protein [Gordonia phage Linetti]|nr:membrane protein [Gordonia phage Linetti]